MILCFALCGCTNINSEASGVPLSPVSSQPESGIAVPESSNLSEAPNIPSLENPELNSLQPNIEKVIVQVENTGAKSALRIVENTEATLYKLAHRIDGDILRALVREEQNICKIGENIEESKYVAISESSAQIEFADGRYYQATASSPTSKWIRIYYSNFSPEGTAAGGAPSTHKDIVVFVDPENTDDALFAWQSLEDQTKWNVYRLPSFGGWLRIELAFCFH